MSSAPRRFRIQQRLFAGFAGVVAVMTVLTVVLVSSGLRRVLTETFEEELSRQLALGEWILAGASGAEPDALAREITARVGYRVSLISEDGVVLGDSYVERGRLADVENHSDRPEVRGALAGDVSFAQRTSATVATPLLYGARVVTLGDNRVVLRVAAPLTDVERAVDRAQYAVYLGGLLAMLAALMIAYLVSSALSRPLVRFVALSQRLADGAFDGRAPSDSGVPELDDLASALNRLTEELEARLSDLRLERDEMQALIDCMAEGVIALTEDGCVSRMNRAARALLGLSDVNIGAPIQEIVGHTGLRSVLTESALNPVSAREVQYGDVHLIVSSRTLDQGGAVTTLLDVSEIRRLEQVRRDFVANASHELRTPLTSIRGYAETLLEGEPPVELRQGFLESIRQNSLRLQRLVEDLLDLSRLESGGWVARREAVRVADAVFEAWDWCEEAALEKEIELTVDAELMVFADRRGLGQVFRNLLENAVRHSDRGGEVRVDARIDADGMVEIDVADRGEGIPSKALPRIFERFYRADSARARDVGGTGLGLAIVRHLLEGMGGSVGAESQVGSGTTIRCTLPADRSLSDSSIEAAAGSDSSGLAPAHVQSTPTTGASSTLVRSDANGAIAGTGIDSEVFR